MIEQVITEVNSLNSVFLHMIALIATFASLFSIAIAWFLFRNQWEVQFLIKRFERLTYKAYKKTVDIPENPTKAELMSCIKDLIKQFDDNMELVPVNIYKGVEAIYKVSDKRECNDEIRKMLRKTIFSMYIYDGKMTSHPTRKIKCKEKTLKIILWQVSKIGMHVSIAASVLMLILAVFPIVFSNNMADATGEIVNQIEQKVIMLNIAEIAAIAFAIFAALYVISRFLPFCLPTPKVRQQKPKRKGK